MDPNEESAGLKRTILIAAALAGFLFLFALWTGLELLSGWFYFAMRVFPKVNMRLDGIAIFIIGTLLASAMTHIFLKWLVHESQVKRNVPLAAWRVSSSVSIVGIVLFIFAIGISMAGIVHQVGWIINSPDDLYVGEVQTKEDAIRSPYQPGTIAAGTHASWVFEILPYLPYLQPNIDRSQPWNAETNKAKMNGLVIQTLCPSQGYPHKSLDGLGLTHVVGNRAVTQSGRSLRINDFEDASQTIMAGEIQVGFSPWAMPNNGRSPKHGIRRDWSRIANESLGFGSSHTAGANMLMIDGSVQFLSEKTDPTILEELGRLRVKKEKSN